MNTLREHLGSWRYRLPQGKIKQWTIMPAAPDEVRDGKEYRIDWVKLDSAAFLNHKGYIADTVLYVDSIEALSRVTAKHEGGYILTILYDDWTHPESIPPSASLTIGEVREIRERLKKQKENPDGFTWAKWIAGETFPNT